MTVWRPVPRVIAVRAAAGFSWLVTAPSPTFAAALPSGPAGVDPARAARDVFQDPGFWWKRIETRTVSTSWLESILLAVWDLFVWIVRKIFELIFKILGSLFGVFTGDLSRATVVVWLVVVALLAWAAWKLYPAIVRWLSGAPAPRTPDGVACQTLAEAADLFEQAGQALRDGLYAQSIRLALLALIARLQQHGLLRYDPTRTNREYHRELRGRSDLAACFGQLARIYERAWYGRLPAGRAEAEQAIDLCGSVINREDLAPE
ncbi:MAG TPA: DUF4129 domain-containing protein [Isosphaeraceae bacterium]|nr:DUF4129 domain-containing protein [Isosphaeraceae bacterium]